MANKKEPKRPNPKYLKVHVGVFLAIGIAIGIAIFAIIHWRLGPNPDPTKSAVHIYDIIRTTIAILGALTVGAAAIIQYRKHIVLETQALLERDSRHSERLTKAIDHLGSEKLSIRKGAVYELKHLAEDSEKIRHDIIRILESHIRENIEDKAEEIENAEDKNEVNYRPEEDVFVAANIVTKLCLRFNDGLNLSDLYARKVSLYKINLAGANLIGAYFKETCLMEANLWDTRLENANFEEAYINKHTKLSYKVREKYFSDAIWVGGE